MTKTVTKKTYGEHFQYLIDLRDDLKSAVNKAGSVNRTLVAKIESELRKILGIELTPQVGHNAVLIVRDYNTKEKELNCLLKNPEGIENPEGALISEASVSVLLKLPDGTPLSVAFFLRVKVGRRESVWFCSHKGEPAEYQYDDDLANILANKLYDAFISILKYK